MRWGFGIGAVALAAVSLWTMWFAITVAGADPEGALGNLFASAITGRIALALGRAAMPQHAAAQSHSSAEPATD